MRLSLRQLTLFVGALRARLDCFVASLLAMTAGSASLYSIVKQPARLSYRHASSPRFFVRPGAAGLLLPSCSRKGVRNAWAFQPHPRPRVQDGPYDKARTRAVLSNAVPRLRSARDGFIRTCCITPLVGSKRRHLVSRSNHAEPSAWGCTWADRLHCVRRPHPPRDRITPALGPGLTSASNHRIPTHKPWRSKLTLSPGRDVVKNIPRDWEHQFLKTTKIEEAC